jgi:hypothetical protein
MVSQSSVVNRQSSIAIQLRHSAGLGQNGPTGFHHYALASELFRSYSLTLWERVGVRDRRVTSTLFTC